MENFNRYFAILSERLELFTNRDPLKIISRREDLEAFEQQQHCKLGVIYESKYHILLVDLVEDEQGRRYAYDRIISPNKYNGVVLIPYEGEKYALLKQFRHASREYELEFPRGFSEPDLSAKANAQKEIYEELGAEVLSIRHEGAILSDSGLTGGSIEIYSISVTAVQPSVGYEGIESVLWVTENELLQLICDNKVRDCFTIAAFAKYRMNLGTGVSHI